MALPNGHRSRTIRGGEVKKMTEWQYRMPEDRHSEDGWMDNAEAGATYLHTVCGAEIRTRVVTPRPTP
jgi:hypothetical protein